MASTRKAAGRSYHLGPAVYKFDIRKKRQRKQSAIIKNYVMVDTSMVSEEIERNG